MPESKQLLCIGGPRHGEWLTWDPTDPRHRLIEPEGEGGFPPPRGYQVQSYVIPGYPPVKVFRWVAIEDET